MFVFSLDSVPPHERFEVYCQHVRSATALDMRMEPVPGDRVGARLALQTIGELRILRTAQTLVARHRRGRAEIARSPLPYYFVHLLLAGSGFIRLHERELAITKGDVFVTDPLGEFEASIPGTSFLLAKVPKTWLAPRVARTDVLHGALVRRDEPLTRLVISYFVNGFETAKELTPDACALFVQHSVELLALALTESPRLEPVGSVALRDALFVRACRLISLRCGDPDLSSETIAQALGVSSRLLQRIFAERDKTLMTHVWAERVSRAAKLLADSRAEHRSITEIAFACGFSDSTHFGRAFAARMGMTPTQWRRQAR